MHANLKTTCLAAMRVHSSGRRFPTIRGAITAVSAFGMVPSLANPGDPAWDAAAREPAAAHLARPSANQYAWHEQERTFFV